MPASQAMTAATWEIEGEGLQGDAGFPALRRLAEDALREALARLRDALGLAPGDVPIRWVLDVSPAPAAREGRPFFKAASTIFEGKRVRVTLPVRKYLRRPEALAPVVAHEAAHAVLASLCGTPERYRSVPPWFREGVALWFSREGDARVRETLAYTVFQGKPASSFLEGISRAEGAAGDAPHAESYLAVRWIEGRLGKTGLAEMCRLAAEGKPLEARAARALAMAPERLRAEALFFAREEVEKLLPPADERTFREVLELREARKDFLPSARKCLERAPEGPLAGTLRYLLARELARSADLPAAWLEARAHLEKYLEGQDQLWRPESLVLLGQLLWRRGEEARARSLWTEVLEAYGEDPVPAAQARKCLEGAGKVPRGFVLPPP